jgi:ninein
VKDLYVENSHLTATIQRMEQQITRQTLMQLAQHHHQPKQQMGSMNSITGMP